MNNPISKLQVIGIRYLSGRYIPGQAIPLDLFESSTVYSNIGTSFSICEPMIPKNIESQDEIINIGILGGKIAEEVNLARREGKAILMTGGNCCHITGIVGGLQDAHGSDLRLGLVWFDAHGDFNTSKTTLSGMLGGMPVAVAAGLTHPKWRELSHIAAPLPTDRIVLVDSRNLDPAEETLIRSTDTTIAAIAAGFPGENLEKSIAELANRVDLIYLHIDSDILDESYTPNHRTKEPNGPNMAQVKSAIDSVMSTGKVGVYAVVSVYGEGEGSDTMIQAGIDLIGAGLVSWKKYGMG